LGGSLRVSARLFTTEELMISVRSLYPAISR